VSDRNLTKPIASAATQILLITAIIVVALVVLFSNPKITGRYFAPAEDFSASINEKFTSSDSYSFEIPQEPPYNLKALKISGSFTGEGTAKVYLRTSNTSYLVFDSSNLAEKESFADAVTGYLTGDGSDSSDSTSSSSDTTNTDVGNSGESSDSSESAEPAAPSSEPNAQEEQSDTTDQSAAGADNSQDETAPAEGNASETENPTQELPSEENITIPVEENQTIELPLNETLENQTIELPLNETLVNETNELTFSNECEETCILPDGLADDTYTLEIEIANGELSISEIAYSLQNLTDIPVNITIEIVDSSGEPVAANITLVDDSGTAVAAEEATGQQTVAEEIFAPSINEISVAADGTQSFETAPSDENNLVVDVQNTSVPIQSIEFENIDATEDVNAKIGVDNVPEDKSGLAGTVEVYAIDPTELNFTEATVTVIATGSALYKCANWDFEGQNCTDGNWAFIQDITPGQQYTFVLTPEDPAFGETGEAPTVQFVSPTPVDGNVTSNNWVYVNVNSADESSQHYALLDWSSSLKGWWRLETNGTSFTDDSGNGNTGSCSGANCPAYNSSGQFGGAYSFDGANDYIDINSSSSLDIGSSVSISLWFYADGCPTQASPENYDAFIYVYSNSGGYHRGIWGNESCQIYLQPGTGEGTTQTNVTYPLNQWTHLAVNFYQSGSDVVHELYIDGVLRDNYTYSSATLWSDAGYYKIGADHTGRYFDGIIDEVVVFNRSLSSQEISALYNATANQYYNNFTSLATGNYTFKAYAVDTAGNKANTETRTVTASTTFLCAVLNTSNSVYTLTGNASASGTCFTIGANNVTLDCAGYTVNYSTSALGYGVNNTGGYNFTTIKNCNFVEGSASGDDNYGIYGYRSYNGTIYNNTINTYKTSSYGIYLYTGKYQNISNNNITTIGNSAHDIYLRGVSNSVINANNIYSTTGSTGQYALYLFAATSNNTLSNNIITTSASTGIRLFSNTDYNNVIYNNVTTGSGNAIDISGGTYANVSYNRVIHASGASFGIYLNTATNATVFYNDINVTGSSSMGIYLLSGANYHDIEFNNISSSGNGAAGIQIRTNSNSNYFNSNNILTYGSDNVGVRFRAGATGNILNNLSILTSGTGAPYPIDSYDTGNNFTMSDSKVNASSGVADFIIRASPAGTWNFTNVTKFNGNSMNISWAAGQNGTLYEYWYLDANVTNQSGTALSGANVSVYYGNSTYVGSSLTDSNGAARFTLLGLMQNSSTTTYYSTPYIVNISKSPYTDFSNSSVNMTNNIQLNVNMGSSDSTPPASVTNLQNQSAGGTWIYWNWTNPADADFSEAIVYINGSNIANTSNNYYNATGLTSETDYTITIRTKDVNGNINNTDVNSTAKTTDITAPATVTSLADQSSSRTWIYWNWTNPTNPDFSQAIININGSNVANTSNNYYNATSLACDSNYVITVHTKDTSNNINNTDVNDTAVTLICNNAPISTTPTITPATAYTNDDLNCTFTITDADAGDTLTANYTWYNSTTAIVTGTMSVTNGTENSIILGAGNTTKTETWNCTIIPYDGNEYGTAKSATKTITNSLPIAPVVDVIPNVPTDDEDLVATIAIASTDADNDSITYSYQWYKNDVLQVGQTANTLSNLLTTIGDVWKCIVMPNDGTGNGATGQDNVTISVLPDTTAPVIILSSPTNNSELSAGTTSTVIEITTNEDAICRYNLTNSTFAYVDGTNFTDTNSTTHNFTLTGLANDISYVLYYKCNDTAGNVNNVSTVHSFSVAAPDEGNNGGGGGTGLSSNITAEAILPPGQPKDLDLAFGNTFSYAASYSPNAVHTIRLSGMFADYVELTITSEPVKVNLKLNETKDIDTNHNGENDIEVTLLVKTNTTAKLRITILVESVLATTQTSNIITPAGLEIPALSPEPLSGAAVQVKPYKAPNPLYAVPTLLLLVLLFTILAIRKENLSERVKRMLTALHVALIVTIVLLLIFTFVRTPLTGATIAISSIKATVPTNKLLLGIPAFLAGLTIFVLVWLLHLRAHSGKKIKL